MKLAVVSHKICWPASTSPSGYATDGGFPMQIEAISELFDETTVVVPCNLKKSSDGLSPLNGRNLKIRPLSVPGGTGLARKLSIPFWLIRNGLAIARAVVRADAVHAPIPGDVGTVGMMAAFLLRKPLFVRHCGNWMVPRTAAEHFWRWFMERYGGGRNVMLATGGAPTAPSAKNSDVKWIFSTSLRERDLAGSSARELPADGKFRLIAACRQEEGKGTDLVIKSFQSILREFPDAVLDIVGDGAFLPKLKEIVHQLDLQAKVLFHGKVEQAQVVALMKRAHVFCFPTQASEGFPKVVLEALASGLPVITTKVSVLPTLIADGGGVLLEEPTATALADAVISICSDPLRYRKLSVEAVANARRYSLERWRDLIGNALRTSWKVSSLSAAR